MKDAWNQTVMVAIPALLLTDASSVHLEPGSDQATTFTVTLPVDLLPGPYDVTVTFVEEGDTTSYEDAFYVPPSNLLFGGVTLGERVGLGPGVKILSSAHRGQSPGTPIMDTPLEMQEVVVGNGADVGAGAILLPGARVGAGAQVGAGAVVTGEVAAGAVVVGVPAREA